MMLNAIFKPLNFYAYKFFFCYLTIFKLNIITL